VSVSPATSMTTTLTASAGPVVLNSPISAKIIATKPTITVPALLAMVSPTRCTVRTAASATRPSSAISSRKRLIRNRQ